MAKKKRKQKKLKVLDINEIYSYINVAQIEKKEIKILIKESDAPILENIVKDCNITIAKKKSTKSEKELCFIYVLFYDPPKSASVIDFENVEDIDDEFFENGKFFNI